MAKPFKNLRDKMSPAAREATAQKTQQLLADLEAGKKVERAKIKSLTRPFKRTVKELAVRDPKFRKGLITEALSAIQDGEPGVAIIMLRDARKAYTPNRKRKYKSRLDRSIYETARDLYAIGAIDEKTMSKFEESCLVPISKEDRDNYELPTEVDFSKAKHEGKFYRTIEKLKAPTYADKKVIEREQKAALAKTKKYRSSRILNEMHETATNLHKSGLIDEKNMRKFDGSCLALPGGIIKRDFMTPQKISITQLSKGTGIAVKDIREIIKGEMSIDVHDARALGAFFKTGPKFLWSNPHAAVQDDPAKRQNICVECHLREKLKDPKFRKAYEREGKKIDKQIESAKKKALTRPSHKTVQERAARDAEFREGLIKETISELRAELRSGDIEDAVDVAITMLKDVKATIAMKETSLNELRANYSGVDLGKPIVGKHYKACKKGMNIVITPKRKYKSRLDRTIHEPASDLYELGATDRKTLSKFDKSCLENEIEIIRGTGNAYRDLGDGKCKVKQAKADIAAEIIATLDKMKLSAKKAGILATVSQADITRIRNARLERLSAARLTSILEKLTGPQGNLKPKKK